MSLKQIWSTDHVDEQS